MRGRKHSRLIHMVKNLVKVQYIGNGQLSSTDVGVWNMHEIRDVPKRFARMLLKRRDFKLVKKEEKEVKEEKAESEEKKEEKPSEEPSEEVSEETAQKPMEYLNL